MHACMREAGLDNWFCHLSSKSCKVQGLIAKPGHNIGSDANQSASIVCMSSSVLPVLIVGMLHHLKWLVYKDNVVTVEGV